MQVKEITLKTQYELVKQKYCYHPRGLGTPGVGSGEWGRCLHRFPCSGLTKVVIRQP